LDEVCASAAASGHAVPATLPEQLIAGTLAMPAYKTSMAMDYLDGRPLEIATILGNVVRAGRQHGVPIPTLETIYALARMVERGRGRD
jgi:2-dehydropantoate 2-reductase